MMEFNLKVSDRLSDLQLELGKVNGLLATISAIGSSEKDGPSSEDVMNMIRVLEDIVSPAYEELTAIVEGVEEEHRNTRPPNRKKRSKNEKTADLGVQPCSLTVN